MTSAVWLIQGFWSVHLALVLRARPLPPTGDQKTTIHLLIYSHNLISKPQLRSYVTGYFGIKSGDLTHPGAGSSGLKRVPK